MPTDLRTQKLAKSIMKISKVKKGENVIIRGGSEAEEFLIALYKEVILWGAHPSLKINLPGTTPFFYKHAQKHQIEKFPEAYNFEVKKAHHVISINTEQNTKELTNIDSKNIIMRQKIIRPISDFIVKNLKWTIVGFPCPALAQDAEMSLTEYENFVFSACLQDWEKLRLKANKILDNFKKAKKVHLIGENVDLKFEIHGEKAVSDLEKQNNIPSGEVFMAPVKNSTKGWIRFEYPSIRSGKEITNIFLKFENGKIIESKADKNEEFLKQMISTDENSAYIGEFGIGLNSGIKKYTNNLLFDEKIDKTIHLALGKAYDENLPENEKRESAIHWDIVKDMKKAKIILDGKVIQDNGIWKI